MATKKTRVTGTVVAGFPSPAEQYVEPPLDLNEFLVRHPAASFFVRVAGDSMVGAGINEGDLLVVDRSLRPADGDIIINDSMRQRFYDAFPNAQKYIVKGGGHQCIEDRTDELVPLCVDLSSGSAVSRPIKIQMFILYLLKIIFSENFIYIYDLIFRRY